METKFKLDDRVDWLGFKGEVVEIDAEIIKVDFESYIGFEYFFSNGCYRIGQEPSLKLIERSKQKK